MNYLKTIYINQKQSKMNLAKNYMAPTPKGWKIAGLVFKAVGIIATLVLPPLGVITIPVGAAIAGAAAIGSVVCSTAIDKGTEAAIDAGLDALAKAELKKKSK